MATIASLATAMTVRTAPFDRGMQRSRANLIGLRGAVHSASASIRALGGVFAGFTAARLFLGLARSGEEFRRSMNQSIAIMGEMGRAMRVDLEQQAFKTARAIGISANDAAKSYFFLASAGLDAQQSLAAMDTVARFSIAGMFDMSRATDLLTDAQSALGLTVKDAAKNMESMTRVGDVLVKANTLANASVEQFATALTTKAGAALKIVGKDIEEGVAVLAAFADQGIKAQDAGTALNIVMRDLTTKSIENAKAFKRNQIAVFDSAGEMRNMADIIGDMEVRLKGMSDETAKATLIQLGFADRSVINIQALLGLSERIREYETGLRAAGGTMADVAGRQLTPFQKAWNELRTSITETGVETGGAVDAFARLATKVSGLIDSMRELGAVTWLVVKPILTIEALWNLMEVGVLQVARLITAILQGIVSSADLVASTLGFSNISNAAKSVSEDLGFLQQALGEELNKNVREAQLAAVRQSLAGSGGDPEFKSQSPLSDSELLQEIRGLRRDVQQGLLG